MKQRNERDMNWKSSSLNPPAVQHPFVPDGSNASLETKTRLHLPLLR